MASDAIAPHALRAFNTVSQQKQPLVPLEPGKLGIYVCGPTVYSYVHIGNARTFTSFDTVVRYLRYAGFQVRYVRNYTDVDDKIIRAAKAVGEWSDPQAPGSTLLSISLDGEATWQGQPALHHFEGDQLKVKVGETTHDLVMTDHGIAYDGRELTRTSKAVGATELSDHYVNVFEQDAAALGLLKPDVSPRVSDTIGEIIALIQKLIANGVAYESKGDVYFEVRTYPAYLKLSKRNFDDLRKRVEPTDAKRDPLDFALWKAAKPGEIWWDSPWGKGRPGWHIECSAMSEKYLGETFDLHGGGLDLIFPHHENEKAQSEAASGKTLCNCWMHGGFLDLDGAKMSKSLGNVVKLRDALKKVDPEALRYFFLSTHYRAELGFSDKAVADCESRLEYFYETLEKVDRKLATMADPGPGPVDGDPNTFLNDFHAAVDDDFNFAGALGVLSGLFSTLNELTDKPKLKDKAVLFRTLKALRELVTRIGPALGLFSTPADQWLLALRGRRVTSRGIDPAWVDAKIVERETARAQKDFALADRLRDEMKAKGVEVMDGPKDAKSGAKGGTRWKVC